MCVPAAMGIASTAVGIGSTYMNYKAGQDAADAANQQSQLDYMAATQNRELALANRAAQLAYQKEASMHERKRFLREIVGSNLGYSFRKEDRSAETLATRLQAVEARGVAGAQAGAAGVSGVSADRLLQTYSNLASRRVADIEEEARRDLITTSEKQKDSYLGYQQNLISINQPVAGVGNVVKRADVSGPSSASLWLGLGQAALGGYSAYSTIKANQSQGTGTQVSTTA